MSGFITILNLDGKTVQEKLLNCLTQSLKYRGPDRQKIWIDDQIGMGHTLFRTTFEAKHEKQPVTLDGKAWIVCSARIDDRENLVNKLGMKREIILYQTPDSELILRAYRKWGESCLDHLLGDFAFVIWDSRYKKIFCARDRFGVRQLYFSKNKNNFILCNSLSCILKHPNITKRLNDKAVGGFLLFGDHTWIDKSITAFKDVSSLPPACKLTFQEGKLNTHKYWDIPQNIPLLHYQKEHEYIEHFLDIFKTSVADRIRTSSITIAMSGGIDSTAIASTARKLQDELLHPAFSIHAVTGLHERLMQCNERYYATLTAEKLNIPIHFISGDNYSLLRPAIATTRPMEMYTPTYWLNFKKLARSYSRVELTGASADNVFACSPVLPAIKELNTIHVLFWLFKLQNRYGNIPPIGSGIVGLLKRGMPGNRKSSHFPYPYPLWLNPEFEKQQQLQEIWKDFFSVKSAPLRSQHSNAYGHLLNPDWSTDDIAFKTEVTLPEERDPFLDLRMVEFAFSLPSIPWLFNKHLVRCAMKNSLPKEVIERPKTPLGNVHSALLQQAGSNWMNSWKAHPELENYAQLNKIPSLFNTNKLSETESYVNLRPVILNTWLNKLLD